MFQSHNAHENCHTFYLIKSYIMFIGLYRLDPLTSGAEVGMYQLEGSRAIYHIIMSFTGAVVLEIWLLPV